MNSEIVRSFSMDGKMIDRTHKSTPIWFLSQYFHPEKGATSELLTGIAFGLSRAGFTIEAIAGQPSYHGSACLPRKIQAEGVLIHRVWSTTWDRRSASGRILNTVTFVLGALWEAFFSPCRALLVAVTNPPLLPWLVMFLNVLRGQRYVLLIHDVYPEIAVELGALPSHSWVTRLWKKLNGFAYRRAERIVVLGRDMQSFLAAQLPPALHERLCLIPNWADAKEIHPLPRNVHPAFSELKAQDRFVVQYSGNIGRFHEIETLVAAAQLIPTLSYLFLFIGTGAQRALVERVQVELGNDRIRLWDYQPRGQLGHSLTACDVGVVTLRAGLSGMAVPSKLYGILAAGKPVLVIGPEDCEAAQAVKEAECGLVVAPDDVKGVVTALERLRVDPELCKAMGIRSRRLFEERYDLSIVVEQWRTLLSEI